MRIAYIISAYKYPEQLGRLLRRLETPQSSFVVHVDKKTEDRVYKRMLHAAQEVSHVHFLERHACHWGGFGHVRATLKGIDHLFRSDAQFDYAVLLTGQDYPLRPASEIERFLEEAEGRSYMNHWSLPRAAWADREGVARVEDWHFVWYHRVHIALPLKRRIPGGLRPFGGGPYWCLSRSVLEHVHHFVQGNPSFARFFEHAFVPDELFFQTIIMNSGLRDSIINDNMRYIDWTRHPAPAILEKADFGKLITSENLFARKFDAAVDSEILDMLDQYIEREAAAHRQANWPVSDVVPN